MHFLPCFMLRSTSIHVYMLGFMFFHVYVLSFYKFTCMFPCLYVQIYVLTCLCAWIYVLYMLYAIFRVPRPKLCLSCHVLLQPFCRFVFFFFLRFGLLVQTQSRPYGLCHRPYTKAHTKGFGSPHFSCLCLLLCFILVLAFLVLGFATFDASQQVCGCVVTFDAHKALLDVTIRDALL